MKEYQNQTTDIFEKTIFVLFFVCPGHGVIVLCTTLLDQHWGKNNNVNFVTVWKILSINIIFHDTLKINSCLRCLCLKIYIFGQYCAAQLPTHNLPRGYQYQTTSREQIKYIANKQELRLATPSLLSRTGCYSFLRQNDVPSLMWTISSSRNPSR